MITEDKVTEIFCIADYFYKVFDEQMAKYTFKAERKRKYHRESRMSKAEIMVIMILFHSSGYRCLKHLYIEKICKHMCHLFPKVVSYNHFVELERLCFLRTYMVQRYTFFCLRHPKPPDYSI